MLNSSKQGSANILAYIDFIYLFLKQVFLCVTLVHSRGEQQIKKYWIYLLVLL
jgi:hypothetical protein